MCQSCHTSLSLMNILSYTVRWMGSQVMYHRPKVSTKGGKYYPLIYPESVGPRKCGHAFFEEMGYLSHKTPQETTTGYYHMEGWELYSDVTQQITFNQRKKNIQCSATQSIYSSPNMGWLERRKEGSYKWWYSAWFWDLTWWKIDVPRWCQEYRCVIIDYVLYENIFITHHWILLWN